MKTFKLASVILFMFGVFLWLGALTVAADEPAGSSWINAPYIDNQAHTIPAGSSIWYRFDYGSSKPGEPNNRPMTTISLKDGNKIGVSFEIWTADQLANRAVTYDDAQADKVHNQPIGRGTPFVIDCNTGNASGSGECRSNDLIWSGKFGAPGTYYVCVDNHNAFAMVALLTIAGNGVRLAPTAITAPSTSAQPKVSLDDPTQAAIIDGQPHSIAASTAMWYRFDYQVLDDGTRPLKTIALTNGAKSGVRFEVWAADQLSQRATTYDDAQADPIHNQPIGRGTTYAVNCDTRVLESNGECQSDNLLWSGAFGTSGTYYVRVVNANANAIPTLLTIQ